MYNKINQFIEHWFQSKSMQSLLFKTNYKNYVQCLFIVFFLIAQCSSLAVRSFDLLSLIFFYPCMKAHWFLWRTCQATNFFMGIYFVLIVVRFDQDLVNESLKVSSCKKVTKFISWRLYFYLLHFPISIFLVDSIRDW